MDTKSMRKTPETNTPSDNKFGAQGITRLAFGVPTPVGFQGPFIRLKTDGKHTTPESSPCSNEECCSYRAKVLTYQKDSFPLAKNKSRKQSSPVLASKTRDKSRIRHRGSKYSSPSVSEDSSIEKIFTKNPRKYEFSERVLNRRNNKTPPIAHISERNKTSYFVGRNREKSRSRRTHKHSVSPIQTSKERCRASNNHSKVRERSRHRPRTLLTPDKSIRSGEKVPYFADVVREKDRLRRKYKSPSPVVTSSKQSFSTSRTPRRSRPRPYSRSRSRSLHRKSESDHHRYKREGSPYKSWPVPPQIITIPVPVPDYSFAFPPYHPQSGWPPFPVRPARLPYFPHHRERNTRQMPFNATLPPMRFIPPYGFDGIPHPNTISPIRPPGRDIYRYPYT